MSSFLKDWKTKENESEENSESSFFKGWKSKKEDQVEKNIEDGNIIRDANDYLTSTSNVLKKLNELGSSLKEKGSEGNIANMSTFTLISCLKAGVSLYKDLNINHPEIRNNLYIQSSKDKSTKKEILECSEWFEYADLAYENKYDTLRKKLKKENFTLMRHDTSAATGRVAHFIALNPKRKIGLIGLKGTSTVSDLLTDALGNPLEIELENSFNSKYKAKKITCHEGIYTAALMMTDDTEDIVKHLFMPLNYKVIICGHSLGAGTACLLGLLLRSRIPSMKQSYPLHVFAYAPPPVLNYDACVAVAPFTTSVVNDTDLVPRMSIPNLWVLDKILGKIQGALKKQKMLSTKDESERAFSEETTNTEGGNLLMEPEEANQALKDVIVEDDILDSFNLFVPGRVICIYRKSRGNKDEEIQCDDIVTDGSARVLRTVVLSRSGISNHFRNAYRKSINAMLQ